MKLKNKILICSLILTGLFMISTCHAESRECVILLHGLGRTHHSMSSIAMLLKRQHYVVVNEDYPSTQLSIEKIADQYISPMIKQCKIHHVKHINFVTHSMGGIVLRAYLGKYH